MHTEYIDTLYKERVKKNKGKNFDDKISEIISSILKNDRDLPSIKAEYKKECNKLLEE